MNKLKIILIAFGFLTIESLYARDAEWLSRKMTELNANKAIEDPILRIEKLQRWFTVVAPAPRDPYEKAIYNAAQEALLATPGHAYHIKNKLESIRARIKNGEAMDPQIYQGAQGGIWYLGHLPSAESVAVLGYFLNDPEGRNGRFVNGESKTLDDGNDLNCLIATRQLTKIGIQSPPVDVKQRILTTNRWEYHAKWKDWWDEVVAGKRTYRFIGSDVEYGPDGPVSKDKLERIKRDQKRDEERSKSSGQVAPSKSVEEVAEKPSASFPATGLAIVILLGGGAWVYYQRKKWK